MPDERLHDGIDAKGDIEAREGATADDILKSLESTDADAPAAASKTPAARRESATAPDAPRWRFVNVAKKSLGYTSEHAGSYIRGRSADELGAKYHEPDVSLYKQSKHERAKDVRASMDGNLQLSSSKEIVKDVEVGELSRGIPTQDEFSKPGRDVGKLSIQHAKNDDAVQVNDVGKLSLQQDHITNGLDSPTGKFAGLPKVVSPDDITRKSFKEWDTSVQINPKNGRHSSPWYDGDVDQHFESSYHPTTRSKNDVEYTLPGNGSDSSNRRVVGRLKFRSPDEMEDVFVGEVPKKRPSAADGGVDANDADSDYGDARHGSFFVYNSGADDANLGDKDSDGSTALTEPRGEEERKKRRCLYLLLLIPLLLGAAGIIIAALWDSGGEEEVTAAAVDGVLLPPIVFVSNETNATSVPTTYPSVSPSPPPMIVCPVGTKPFSVEVLKHDEHYLPPVSSTTWKVKNACSDEIIAQCPPCMTDEPTRHLKDGVPPIFTQCLAADNRYTLEVLPAEEDDECCGFDVMSSTFTFDNAVVKDITSDKPNGVSSAWFGESDELCAPGPPPSKSPTAKPTCSTEQDFNLCFALDMSGSVCNGSSGSDCLGCADPSSSGIVDFFGDLFGFSSSSECRDDSVSEDICCRNFGRVAAFSKLMVKSLGDFPAKKSFSIVQFATDAQIVGGLSSSAQTSRTIENLDYTGGLTNTARAIQLCQETLQGSDDRKKFIVVVTDGVPSQPDFDPDGAALRAATLAKNDGAFIIPVFISPNNNDWSAYDFMRSISSDMKVFDVTDFGKLDGLQDQLVNQVSCS